MGTRLVEEEPNEDVVIDGVSYGVDETFYSTEIKKLTGSDPFGRIEYSELDKNAKRRADRLVKRLQGTGGAEAKHVTIDQINGYQLYGLAMPPFNLDYLTELAIQNPIHYACIMAKTVNIVGLGYNWAETSKIKIARQSVEDDDSGTAKLARKLSRVTDQLDEIIDSFNEEDGIIDTLEKAWQDYEATGQGYIEVGRNRNGTIGYVGHVPAAGMRVRIKRDGFIQMVTGASRQQLVFFRNFGDTTTPNPLGGSNDCNEIIHIKKYSTANTYYGVPDIIAAMHAIAGDKFSAEYNLEYFENKAVPRYALIVKGAKLSQQAERKILEYFRKEVKGKHHGTLYIPVPAAAGTNVDVKLEAIENKIQDSSFDKYRAGNRSEIAAVHRVPLSQLGMGGESNMSASREESKMFKMQVVRPEQRKAERKINLIIKEITDMYRFKLSEFDLLDEETKSRIHDRYIRTGVLNSNEVRTEIGLHPRKGGDKYLDPAAESEAKIGLTEAQAQVALDPPPRPVATTATGGKGGPARHTTDGSPKNNGAGTVKTPVDSTSRGRDSKGERQDKTGK